jgi:ABC-type uncharacterized transport system substrate-binding protein
LNISNIKTYDELRPIAKGYVENRTDVIVTYGGTATGIAREATKEISIIFIWGLADPVAMGFVKSLARPETNITGLSSMPNPEISGKRLELFKEVVPTLRRAVLLYNARGENPSQGLILEVVRNTAPKLGLILAEKPIKSAGEAVEALLSVSKENTDGIYIVGSGLLQSPVRESLIRQCRKDCPYGAVTHPGRELCHLMNPTDIVSAIAGRGTWTESSKEQSRSTYPSRPQPSLSSSSILRLQSRSA